MSEDSLPSRGTSPDSMISDWTYDFESPVGPSSSQSGEIEDSQVESEKIQPLSSSRRHFDYYFDDGNVTLLVDGTLYRIHRYLLQKYSAPISPVFTCPHDSADDAPILLAVSTKDFDTFLSILYPVECSALALTTVDEWTSILRLAVEWNFQSIKNLAVERLSAIATPVDKIVLGRRFDIFEWLENAYTNVCWRDEALTIEEGKLLGVEDVIEIAAMRQWGNGSDFIPGSQTIAFRKTFGLHGLNQVSNSGKKEDKHAEYRGPLIKGIKKKRKGKNHRGFLYTNRISYDL
ncbi:hypothetical protein PILCRDRAFT_827 [Piloderma croceum F 1598]|uniref:BTB domain-containing protein n=1 Tax=Piloderma croceum (strain F 1598) TaxID=765440 RepID=A0A0C3BYU1_PILCF|nr:hypothetical protein PILCRDRAFT_827 [Piloderma croceum F 1598]